MTNLKLLLNKLIDYTVRFYKRDTKLFFILAAGLLIAFSTFCYFSVELTSTPAFCVSCHEMKPAYDTWVSSTHHHPANNKKQATCRDCHVPPWTNPVAVLYAKAYHGIKDVLHHFTEAGEFNNPQYFAEMRDRAPKSMSNSSCLACHSDIYSKRYDGYANIHSSFRDNPNSRCAECHKGLAHYNPKYTPYYKTAEAHAK